MALNIKSERADRLARELSVLTGDSITDAVTAALEARLEEERRRRGRAADLSDIVERFGELPVLDARSPEELLGLRRGRPADVTVVDSSAIVALLLDEPDGARIARRLAEDACVMSAATRVEVGIVIEARAGAAGAQLLDELIQRSHIETLPVDEAQAAAALVAWRRFGKGRHRAGLNYGDTFAYALARTRDEPLLCVGDDFVHTDIELAR